LLEGTDVPIPAPAPAAEIVLPSTEGLNGLAEVADQASGSDDGAKHNAVLGKIVAEALHGGDAGASIDALLDALPPAPSESAAAASAGEAAVPGWDSGHFASLPVPAAFTMEAIALHHDAVQPA
jgi:hypothetical protein